MKYIIKFRHIIFGLAIVLFVIGIFMITKVKINYDGTVYLPDNTNTKQALVVMEKEFGNYGACEVMVDNISQLEAQSVFQSLNETEGIRQAEFYANQEGYYQNNKALYKIIFNSGTYDDETNETLDRIKTLLADYDIYLRGESVTSIAYNNVLQDEIIKIVAILLPIVLIILFLMTTSWIEPLLFVIVVLVAVLINMGTNVFFPSVSYMTHATCGILQLALCMDYAVMMLSSYKAAREKTDDVKKAVKIASRESFLPVLASMLTTVAGFVALLFMKYTIGFDVGIVLIKGTLLSFAATFLLMPGLIVIFAKLLEKTKHRSIFRQVKMTYKFLYKTRFILPVAAVILIGVCFFVQQKNTFDYSETKIVYESPTLGVDYNKIKDTFGFNNNLVILVPKGLEKEAALMEELQPLLTEVEAKTVITPLIFYTPYTKMEFTNLLRSFGADQEAIDGLSSIFDLMIINSGGTKTTFSVVEMVEFVQTTAFLTDEQKAELEPFVIMMNQAKAELEGTEYDRFLIVTDMASECDEAFKFIDDVETIVLKHYEEYYLLGDSVGIKDVKTIIDSDYWKITIITVVLVFVIILFSFRNIFIPIFLVFLILGATWINMSVPVLLGTNLLYVGYIVVSSIMLGATIDYAILYTHKYQEKRLIYDNKIQAMEEAFFEAKHTVLTSGLILIFAGYSLGFISTIPSVAVFGSLIGRGAIASVVLVLFVLPQILFVCDKIVVKKNKKEIITEDNIEKKEESLE